MFQKVIPLELKVVGIVLLLRVPLSAFTRLFLLKEVG